MRHLDVEDLWIQEAVRTNKVDLVKVLGTENPADLFTKYLESPAKIEHILKLLGMRSETGRAASAPAAAV